MLRTPSIQQVAAVAAGAAVVMGGLWWKSRAAAQPAIAVPAAAVTLLVTLGERAASQERWDGAARVAGGSLLAVEGRHFSQGDAVTGSGTWRCATRRDAVAPYADIHYTEMRPGSQPEVLHHPVGVFLTVAPGNATRVSLETAQGNFDFALDAIGAEPAPFLNGRATVVRVPTPEKLTTGYYEDDEPAILALPDSSVVVAWVAYRDRADRIFLRTRSSNAWTAAEEVTVRSGDIFRCSLAYGGPGTLWVFWSEREGDRWQIWGRRRERGSWTAPQRISGEGTNTFHRAVSTPGGQVFVTWQSFRRGQSDIYLRAFAGGKWSAEMRLSESPAKDWEPAIAAGPNGAAYVAWDSYDQGNYDIQFRAWERGALSELRLVTSSPKFQAHASVAVDGRARPWVAWDESGVNWGKDQGFLIPTPLAVPLHQERTVRAACWDGSRWIEPRLAPAEFFPPAMRQNAEHPQILFDGGGHLHMVFRHWTRRQSRVIGSPQVWENYLARFDGVRWSAPRPLPSSGGWIEKHAALARGPDGNLWAAWMTDGRSFATMVPQNADVYCTRLRAATEPVSYNVSASQLLAEPPLEAIPAHANEPADVKAIRAYTITEGGRQYRIYRGDMHRHTDISQDFKYDGSLIEVYRYGLDAAAMDYIAPTDHQTGYDQEYSWWQSEKLADLFHVNGSFTPLFGSERSVLYPNGHRNVFFAQRGVRPLPIPAEEAQGKEGPGKLYAYLRRNRGIAMPHSSATNQGTNWRDNDPEVEPLVEIYQGYRTSYEYEGAPRAATALNPQAQKSGWQPSGFWWNALAKGYKLGVQSSSDHWSTHISYACILAERLTREGLLDAMRRRHAYAATDNIILDFRAGFRNETYLMGDSFTADATPQFRVRAIGTGAIKQVDLVKNMRFVYTARPGAKEHTFEFVDKDFNSGDNWYYVRVLQEDGQLAWSSPIWVRKPPTPPVIR